MVYGRCETGCAPVGRDKSGALITGYSDPDGHNEKRYTGIEGKENERIRRQILSDPLVQEPVGVKGQCLIMR